MARYVIVPIVEGDGEVNAVPILLRGWLGFCRYRNVEVHSVGPIHSHGKGNITAAHDRLLGRGVEHHIRLALLRRPQPDIILILLDADEDPPAALAAGLLNRARTMVPADYPVGVVVANRKYEAWFLAAFASAKFRRGVEMLGYRPRRQSLPRRIDVEAISDCEGRLEKLIDFRPGESSDSRPGRYRKTNHQHKLTQILPFKKWMTRRSPSFGTLLDVLDELLKQARRRRSS